MAGHWIKWEKGLVRKPEIKQIARIMKITPHEAAARCMTVWEWADDVTVDGTVSGMTADDVDQEAGIRGFAKAMERISPQPWLVIQARSITFPNYARHNGRCAKERAEWSRRQAESRKRHADA